MNAEEANLGLMKLAKAGRLAMKGLAQAGVEAGIKRSNALLYIADALEQQKATIQEANLIDLANGKQKGLTAAVLDRLILNDQRIASMAEGVRDIAGLEDPIGKVFASWNRPNGLIIERVRTPLGLIGVIFESRPNVTIDAAALAIKSGNGIILRGGSDSINTSLVLSHAIGQGISKAGLDPLSVQVIPTIDREWVGAMLAAYGLIDVIIPRGGKSLTERVMQEAKVPVLAHLEGIVHVYIHEDADFEKAIEITLNAKMRRTGVCGAAEALLIDRKIAAQLLPKIITKLQALGCEVRGDAETCSLVANITPAKEDDFGHEFLDAIIAVKIVKNVDEALSFIDQKGSHHTDAIITENKTVADRFLNEVDSAIVMHNASTQFADGGQFGMGAEIGISTGRLHARGPIGVEQLTCFKYNLRGNGQCRP